MKQKINQFNIDVSGVKLSYDTFMTKKKYVPKKMSSMLSSNDK